MPVGDYLYGRITLDQLSCLERVKTQSEILLPLFRRSREELGKEGACELLRFGVCRHAKSFGKAISAQNVGTSLEKLKAATPHSPRAMLSLFKRMIQAYINQQESGLPWNRKKITLEKRIMSMLLYVAFTVKRAHGLFPPMQTLKDLKDLQLNEIGRWKRVSVADVGRKRGHLPVGSAKCQLAQQIKASIVAYNVKSIPALP